MWIDSHTHLQFPQFKKDVDAVVERAHAADVDSMIVVGTDLDSSRLALEFAGRFGLYATVGIHPHDAANFGDGTCDEIRQMAEKPRVAALGEIGLDYARDYSPRAAQITAFRSQLELAGNVGLPVVVHCRDAADDVMSILDEVYKELAGGVLHCFSGDDRLANMAANWGFHISAAGHITRPNNGSIRETLARVPMDALLVETDCPYLLPVTVKRKGLHRNEPAFVPAVGECLAKIKGVALEDIERVTAANAVRLFGLDLQDTG